MVSGGDKHAHHPQLPRHDRRDGAEDVERVGSKQLLDDSHAAVPAAGAESA
jgi:hypothetical protein